VFGIDKSLVSTFDKFFFLAASSAAKLIGAEDLAEVLTVLTTGGGVVVEVEVEEVVFLYLQQPLHF